ncbi:hypothetical protein FBU59_001725 [Linderina macrospora]|uniref:Uncharacterized protein n=1 Tax=Linderina macrospora TaxID=4868 RepID=A0ACC1JDC9_9FUNG|nr:hypothetical protein FBU59_001725 [Linderina macrospora]
MGQRVLAKISTIIDEEMQRVGGQKLSMPTLLTPDNWKKTGRWDSTGEELFTLEDRKKSTLILGPTHEEEVTAIVKDMVRGYRQYPLRLYQMTRKFRDEARPRAGLLRGREFVMKDMYSFDVTKNEAIGTFEALEEAYRRCFDRIGVPYIVADADSGNIGGSLSKEFHFANPSGEDTVYECKGCGYTANEERAQSKVCGSKGHTTYVAKVLEGDRVVRSRLVAVPESHEPSAIKVKRVLPVAPGQRLEFEQGDDATCDEPVMVDVAIEVGHIFYLGEKYSKAMDLTVLHEGKRGFVQMGCFGIGVTRILQAAVECCNAGGRGVRWPLAIAPFLASVVPLVGGERATAEVYGVLQQVAGFKDNVLVDDREYLSPGFRLNDAQLLGIPVTVVLGKRFAETGEVEVQLRVAGRRLPESVDGLSLEDRDGSGHEYRADVPLARLARFLELALGQ